MTLDEKAPTLGAFSSLFGTGWDDVPKQCSSRRVPAKKRTPRKGAVPKTGRRDVVATLPMDEGITKCTHEARGLVLAAWPEIVRGLIEKAVSGGYQQTKLLLDLCGLTDVDASKLTEGRRQQLCDVLLEGLGLSLVEMDDSKSSVETSREPGTRGHYEEQQ